MASLVFGGPAFAPDEANAKLFHGAVIVLVAPASTGQQNIECTLVASFYIWSLCPAIRVCTHSAWQQKLN
jgi:hypothetical protein